MSREAVTPSAAAPGDTRVTRSSGVTHSPQPPVAPVSEARDLEAAGPAEHRGQSVEEEVLEEDQLTRGRLDICILTQGQIITGLTSGSVTSCQIVTLISSVRALREGALTPAPMMSTQVT